MAPAGPAGPPVHIEAQPRIVTADDVATQAELEARGERALLEQRWKDASDAYRLLLAADPNGSRAPGYLFDLGLSLEGLERRADARDTFLDLARRFPDGPKARAALVRVATLDAYLEDWSALEAIGEELLARPDVEDIERIVALGARGLARVERLERGAPAPAALETSAPVAAASPAPVAPGAPSSDERRPVDASLNVRASADILEGLDLSDRFHYGDRDVLPVAVAQLRFALGELRRVRSERIGFEPLPPISSRSSMSGAPACSTRRQPTRRRFDRWIRTGPPCRAIGSARCIATSITT